MAARSYPPPSPDALPSERKLTRDEYHRMGAAGIFRPDERVELIQGTVVSMPPMGPRHADAASKIAELLILQLRDRARVRTQLPIASESSEPEPDVAVVPRADYSKHHPERAFLAVEVADSSLRFDRDTKAPLYAASHVDEYWIVDVAGRAIEVYTQPENGRYASMRRAVVGDRVSPAAFSDVVVDVAALFA
jgi:Uma2 family endonuclease